MKSIPSICHIRMSVKSNGRTQSARLALEELRKKIGGCSPSLVAPEYSHLNFNAIIQIDENLEALIYRSRNFDLLEKTRLSHWGCNSAAIYTRLEQKPFELVFNFTTAEVPPMPVLERLVSKFQDMTFKIEHLNEATGIHGVMVSRQGKLLKWQKDKYEYKKAI